MNNPIIVTDRVLSYYDSKLKGYVGSFYGCDMIVEWEPMENGKNYFKLKIALKNKQGDELFSKIVDFPLEQTIVSGEYNNKDKSLILYFQDGSYTSIPIEDLIEGLASKLDLEKKADHGENQVVIGNDYSVDIPTNSAPYAQISKIGGMTYKVDNTLRDAKVTEVKSVGRNLFNPQLNVIYTNGCSVVENNGALEITATGSDPFCHMGDRLGLDDGDYYFYSETTNNAYIELWDGVGRRVPRQGWFTVSRGGTGVHLELENYAVGRTDTAKIGIYKKETNEFIPYTEHTLAIPESVQSLEGYGLGINLSLYNYIDFENKKFNRVVKSVVLNGTENWIRYSDSDSIRGEGYCYSLRFEDGAIGDWRKVSICSSFNNVIQAWDNGKIGDYGDGIADRAKYFVTDKSTLEEWKSYLASNHITIVYELATPTTEDIPEISNLIGVEGNGTITFENEYGYNVPYEIEYTINSNDVIGAKEFVGNLKGTAEVAKYYDDNGNPSAQTIGEALNKLLDAGNPIKITTESIGQLSTTQVLTGISANILANPPVAINDIILDRYLDGDAAYLCFWVVTDVQGGSTDSTMTLQGAGNIYVGGGNSSIADRAISDGNGKNIAETYETKAQVKAITDEIKSTTNSAYERATVAINTAQNSLNRVNRGVYSIDADYTSGAGSIGTFYLRVNFVGGGSESYDITEELRGLINDVLTYDR